MYDASPLSPPVKGETKAFLPTDIDPKALEALFDLDPSLETSFDLTDFITGAASDTGTGGGFLGVPDSAAVTSSGAAGADPLVTLTGAAAIQHLVHITNANNNYQQQLTSPGPLAAATAVSPVGLPHQQPAPPQLQGSYKPALSPSLTVDEVSQALSDDNCVFMPEFEPLAVSSAATTTTSGGGEWGQAPLYSTVKTEDLTLCSLTACSLEASLPGFSTTTTTTPSPVCKMEYDYDDEDSLTDEQFSVSSPGGRSLSESSSATTPDSSRRLSKGGSRRRSVPKGSEEYKEKRARNNVAVRKSRAKAKEKQRTTESRVNQLVDLNDSLQKKVEMLTKELTVLKGLFVNVGASLPADFAKIMEQS